MQSLNSGQARCWRIFLLPLLFATLISQPSNLRATISSVLEGPNSVTIHLGIGSKVSYLAFHESTLNPKPIIYAWHYNGFTNPTGEKWTGTDMLNAVITETSSTPWALNYFTGAYGLFTSWSIGSTTSRVVDPLLSPVWTYWIRKGSQFVEYGDQGSFTFTVGSSFMIAPASSDTRFIEDGSYDAWNICPFSYDGVASDTHSYLDILGNIQYVTYGTYEEILPQTSLSLPILTLSTRLLPNQQIEIIFRTTIGATYQLEKSISLSTPSWQSHGASFLATSTEKVFILPMDSLLGKEFFRLVAP